MQTRGIIVESDEWEDFQSIARSYGIEFLADRTDEGYVILSDTDIAEDILWSISLLDGLKRAPYIPGMEKYQKIAVDAVLTGVEATSDVV